MTNNHNDQRVAFGHFLEKFPEVELPIILGEDAIHIFSKENDPLPALMVEQIILPIENESPDEWTEYVPCFRIPETGAFHAIVYWKAGLMNYQYVLATFSEKGERIDHWVIAGIFSDGKTLTSSVATIDADWSIFIVSGQTQDQSGKAYDPASSKSFNLELLADGRIADLS